MIYDYCFFTWVFLEAVSPPPSDMWPLPSFGVNIYTINVLVKSFNLCFNPTQLCFFIGFGDPSNKSVGSVVIDQ
jgi:hypothetical protein